MSDKFKDRTKKSGFSRPSQDHDPQPQGQGHQQQQLEGAAAQDPVNPRPIHVKKRLRRRFVREASSDEYYLPIGRKGKVNTPRSSNRGRGRGGGPKIAERGQQRNVSKRVRFTFRAEGDEYVSYESTDSPTPSDDTEEDPTYDIDKEEQCKTGSIKKSSRKRPDDDKDPPGLAKSKRILRSSSSSRMRSTLVK